MKYSGLQDKRRSFRSFFNIPTAELTGSSAVTREGLISVPPKWDGNHQELFEFLKKEAARLEAQPRNLRRGAGESDSLPSDDNAPDSLTLRGTEAVQERSVEQRRGGEERGGQAESPLGGGIATGRFGKEDLGMPPQATEALDRLIKEELGQDDRSTRISGGESLVRSLSPDSKQVREGPEPEEGLPLQRDAAGGTFVLYGLLDVEDAIAPFYFDALHRGDSSLDERFRIDDNFSVESPAVQEEIAKRQDPTDRRMFENSLWLAGVKQRLRTKETEKRGSGGQSQAATPSDAQGNHTRMPETPSGAGSDSADKKNGRAPPFRCSVKVPVGETELSMAREQELQRRKGLRTVLDSESAQPGTSSEDQESESKAVLLPYRREWRPCDFDEWLELIEGQEAPALLAQVRPSNLNHSNSRLWRISRRVYTDPGDRLGLGFETPSCT